jgi:hypothetical protein
VAVTLMAVATLMVAPTAMDMGVATIGYGTAIVTSGPHFRPAIDRAGWPVAGALISRAGVSREALPEIGARNRANLPASGGRTGLG